jgi:hypothetical protein
MSCRPRFRGLPRQVSRLVRKAGRDQWLDCLCVDGRPSAVQCRAMSNALKSDQLSLRIDPVIRERLEAAAEQDRRPVSNLVRNVLADWADQPHRGREVA